MGAANNGPYPEPIDGLWDAYWESGRSESIRDRIVEHYYGLVAPLVARLGRRLPSGVDTDLLQSAAGQGLVEAVEQFNPEKSRDFRRYAELVMRRRVTDELRRHDRDLWRLRTLDSKRRHARQLLSQKLGRTPSEEELDEFLRPKPQNAGGGHRPPVARMHRSPSSSSSTKSGTEEGFQSRDLRDQAILDLYLRGNSSQKKIAELFGITQARVSQIVSRVRRRLIP